MGRGLEGKCGSHSSGPMREAGDARARPRAGARRQQPRPATEGPAGKLGREPGWRAGPLLDAARWGAGGVATTWWRGGASAELPERPRRRLRSQVPGGEASFLSPERGWAGPGHSRASVSTPGTVLASLALPLESQLLPPSLPRFVHAGSKCWVRPPARLASGPPGTQLTAAP